MAKPVSASVYGQATAETRKTAEASSPVQRAPPPSPPPPSGGGIQGNFLQDMEACGLANVYCIPYSVYIFRYILCIYIYTQGSCRILLRLHRSFQLSTGLDETSFPSRRAYPHFHCFLYSSLSTGMGSSSHPNFLLINHNVACTRRRTGECGKSKRIRLFLRPLRSTVTRLISASCKSSSGRRKIYLVLRQQRSP